MARRPPSASAFVYFVQAQTLGLIKIGIAVEPMDRLYTLQCGSPDKLSLLGVIRLENARGGERGLHGQFREHRSHGEWFRPAPDLMAYIAANAADYDDLLSTENRGLANALLG